ncbi:hypothetical protein [Aquamicrobium soli]|jgi:hypothetical protein|uniref:Uncharacterized protein n=1 Tax=Aquamicrobium soli TaxID=1811518 RepID=A0ABV7KDJ1_9HYPH
MNKIIPENKARQGRWGWRVLAVLIASLALIAIVWAAVEFYGEAIEPGSDIPQTGAQQTGTQTGTSQTGTQPSGTSEK